MPETYTQVRNLFDFPGVLNANIVNILPMSAGPFRLNYTQYSDGRIEIDGNFYIAAGQTIADDEQIIDLSDTTLFGSFTAGNTSFIITTEDTSFKFGGATYSQSQNGIFFRASADILTLTSMPVFYIRGTIVPNEIKSLPAYLWGG